ncbi:hypothetical protein M426DRAFT_261904 [Hypoxylon sp. CI-4A]|nr:hypothetical protein M426DRAFT_261904 [Hypoxylon sp. CI-4A]
MADTELQPLNGTHTPGAGHWINAVTWVLIGLATTFLILRLFCKLKRGRGLWWDDWILIASWLVLIAAGIISTISVEIVFFRLDQDNRIGVHDVGLLTTITGSLFFIAAIWSKTSFAITLYRIAGPRLKIVLRVIMVSMNGATCVSVILRWLQCHPTRLIWDSSVGGTCWDRNLILGFTIFAAAYSAFMDFVLAALPWPIVIKLQIRTSEKIGISIAMSMGVCAGITAIVKTTKLGVVRSEDFADNVFELSLWSVAEIATTIMAASIPVLRALVHEATGTRGHVGYPSAYMRDRSRQVGSRLRSYHTSLTPPGRSRVARSLNDALDDERMGITELNIYRKTTRMDEVHVQPTDRSPADSMDFELQRIPHPHTSWV